MTVPKRTPRVAVEGKCPAGHVVKTEAPRGATTWTGTCPYEGCEHTVTARRVPYRPDGAPPANVTESATESGIKIRRVRSWNDDPGFERGKGDPGAGSPAPGSDGEGTGVQDPTEPTAIPLPATEPTPAPAAERPAPAPVPPRPSPWRRRPRPRRAPDADDGELYPGIY